MHRLGTPDPCLSATPLGEARAQPVLASQGAEICEISHPQPETKVSEAARLHLWIRGSRMGSLRQSLQGNAIP